MRLILLFVFLYAPSIVFAAYPSPDSHVDIEYLPTVSKMFNLGSTSLSYSEGQLFWTHNGKHGVITENEKGIGNDGVDIVGLDIWSNVSTKGTIIVVIKRAWFQAASNYGETRLLQFVLLERVQNDQIKLVDLGQIEAGSLEKGAPNKIGLYSMFKTHSTDTVTIVLHHGEHCNNNYKLGLCSYRKFEIGTLKIKPSQHNYKDIQPSFDCASKLSITELRVCQNLSLSKLDQDMSIAYQLYDSKTKKAEQLKWIKSRNECVHKASSHRCLLSSYIFRIQELKSNANKN